MEFIPENIANYAAIHTSLESDLLKKINRDTHLHVLKPRMLSGHLQGRLLAMISQMIKPTYILEIGTYTGYSALCLAEGLHADGQLVTIDCNAELAPRVQRYFDESNFSNSITYQIGNALELIPHLTYPWDLVFIDADKENYSRYFDLVFDQLTTGGFIIADNVLWSGKVTDKEANDFDTQQLRLFNEKVLADSRVENVLLPVRDGLMLVRKK